MKNILFIGQLTDVSGYGNAARCYLDNLIELHEENKIVLSVINFSFESHSDISVEWQQKIKKYSLTNSIEIKRGKYKGSDLKSIEQFSKGKYEIVFFLLNDWLSHGYKSNNMLVSDTINLNLLCNRSILTHPCVVWETNSIPEIWKKSYDKVNLGHLICACTWNEKAFSSVGKTITIPYSIDFEESFDQEYYEKLKNIIQDNFAVCSVFQWNQRKGVEKLILSYYLEFFNNPNVFLILKTYINRAMGSKAETLIIKEELQKQLKKINFFKENMKPKCKVIILNDIMSKAQVNSIYKASNSYYTTTRGEGFGLPIAEFINHSKPVIVPNIGGHLDFIDKNNSFLIKSNMEPVLGYNDHLWSQPETNWVEVSINSTREQLRNAYKSNKLKLMGKNSKNYMKDFLNSKKSKKLFMEVFYGK